MPRKKTPEEYYSSCKEKGLDLPIEPYVNSRTKIKHKCKKCNNIYSQKPSNHLSDHGCPKCATIKLPNKRRKTAKEYTQECKEKGLDLPIEPYVNSRTKIKHKCKKCNNIYSQKPSNHLSDHGCPKCATDNLANIRRKSQEWYIEECKDKGYDLPIEEYKGAHIKIKHKCSKGHVYKQTPDDHLHNKGCPVCNESHGERFIRNYLDKNNIKYISQRNFKDLKDKTYLSYDFYLPKQNVLIEYQGQQHFIAGGNGNFDKDYFPTQQYHDKLKYDYAINNGYTLLEPTYKLDTQEKVNSYLDKHLKGLL